MSATAPVRSEPSTAPARAGVVLTALILVAAVANLPMAVANVALPDIGLHFDASQTQLNLVAVAYSLGLGLLGALVRGGGRPLRARAARLLPLPPARG